MSLGTTLTALRKKAKLTQSELGERLNISAQAISKWENDASEPDISTIKKLASIYGVTIYEILEPSNTDSVREDSGTADSVSNKNQLWDVYLASSSPNKLALIKDLRTLLGIDLKSAKEAVDRVELNTPFLISSSLDEETSNKVAEFFASTGASVSKIASAGLFPPTPLSFERPLYTPSRESKYDYELQRRFITANLTGGIPAVLVLIISLILSSSFLDVLISIYAGISTYTLIFLLWYPTLTRALLVINRMALWAGIEYENILDLIPCLLSLLLFVLLLPWLVIVALISPYN